MRPRRVEVNGSIITFRHNNGSIANSFNMNEVFPGFKRYKKKTQVFLIRGVISALLDVGAGKDYPHEAREQYWKFIKEKY